MGDLQLAAVPLAALHLRAGVVVEANDRAVDLLGDPAAALHALLPEDADALAAELALVESGELEHACCEVRGDHRPPRRFLQFDLGRHPAGGVVAVVQDCTERHRLDAALGEFATGLYVTDAWLRGIWMPERTAETLGLSAVDFRGVDVVALVHPDDREAARNLGARAQENAGVKYAGSLRIEHPSQPGVYWPIVAYVCWLPHDDALGGLLVRFDAGLSADVHQDSATPQPSGVVTLGDASPLGFLNLNLAGDLLQRSTRVREILRPVSDRADGADWMELVRAEERPIVEDLLAAARRGESLPAEEVGFTNGSAVVWTRLEVVPYRNQEGEVVGTFVNLLDVTTEREARDALAAAREELWHLANHDTLTGLLTRVPFGTRLERRLEAMGGASLPALLVCDLDGFKDVNDQLGHAAGDAVLVTAARRIEGAVRSGDSVCRFGGDEFVVLSEVADATELRALAERIVACFAEPIGLGGHQLDVGVSIGAALAETTDTSDPDGLFRRADRAMYAAKAAGRRCAVLA